MDKLSKTLLRFDEYNQQDPIQYIWEGKSYPQEYFFAKKVYDWTIKLEPDASEETLLASRCLHIGRWEIPRDTYPEGRIGYLNWRKDLAHFHAKKAGSILESVGYGVEQIERVKQLILKKHLKTDRDVQTLENALCLVFLQFQYEDFRKKHTEDKVVNILRKSLLKMDKQGHEQALKLNYSAEGLDLINKALKLLSTTI